MAETSKRNKDAPLKESLELELNKTLTELTLKVNALEKTGKITEDRAR